MQLSNEELVHQAKGGDKDALETLIQRIQNQIYNLAVRMLYDPADAEDAVGGDTASRLLSPMGSGNGNLGNPIRGGSNVNGGWS